ncbi:hypothetical protein JMJ77_0014860 [Colletotrichum scovillei]|uniref:Uncharacterized protein n=1 Tax=Colletotrichum scovillei TaxID=1209932 RepID=A0A9P7QZE8_9PEZI|nr:hypothetical protein JMJ77_0014860 [Colletotrichum scovillei]KAG7056471.1 hypothetical protein JMJ78_0000270 [Colletotrichum scovillei]KAG7066405.1 hypothetical protein JMJ76_0000266 [Colletotrichum scovillei]
MYSDSPSRQAYPSPIIYDILTKAIRSIIERNHGLEPSLLGKLSGGPVLPQCSQMPRLNEGLPHLGQIVA